RLDSRAGRPGPPARLGGPAPPATRSRRTTRAAPDGGGRTPHRGRRNPRPGPGRGPLPAGAEVVLDHLAAYGTGHQVREQLQPWDHAADIVSILLPPGMPWHNIEATLQAAAPSAAAPSAPPSRCQPSDRTR